MANATTGVFEYRLTSARAYMTCVRIGAATLYHGDCRDILSSVQGDVVLTDPPYSVSVAGAVHKQRPGKGSRRLDFFDGDADWVGMTALVISALDRVVASKPLTVICWCGHRQIGAVTDLLERQGYKTRLLFWRKSCPPPATPNSGFASSVECCVYGYAPGFAWNGGAYEHNVFQCDNYRHGQPGKVDHPTQKPLQLIKWQVGLMTRTTDVVLDPFMGSGTTGVACIELGRPFIGIEIERKYFDIACERISAAERQADLFAPKQISVSKQTAMLV